MALVCWVTEMGVGVDVQGHGYTKAAVLVSFSE
jgi:hypothetical protein